MYGLANCSSYSATRRARSAFGSTAAAIRSRKMMFTAPSTPMTAISAVGHAKFMVDAGQEAGHVDERHDRDVEAVACSDEPRRLVGCVDVENAGQHFRLLRHDPDRPTLDAREATHDVARVLCMHFGE